MKFSILGFNQILLTSIVGYTQDAKGKMKELRLDMNDLIIIKEIADFMNRKKIIKYTIDDKTYFSIQYQSIIEDLPILGIKKQALADRIDKLVFLNIIEKKVVKTQIGSFTAFRLTDIYEELQYGSTSSKLLLQKYQTTSAQVVDYEPKYNTTNTSITNTNKEDTKVSEKKDAIDFSLLKSKWEEINPDLPSIRCLNDKRKKAIKALLKNNNAQVDDLIKSFKVISICSFCQGENNRSWKATFDWLINDTKSCFNRLLEGDYCRGAYEKSQCESILNGNETSKEEANVSNNSWQTL